MKVWLHTHLQDDDVNRRITPGREGDDRWIRADLLLRHLFSDFTNARVRYEKAKHSLAITKILLAEHPEHLHEIAEFLRNVLGDLGGVESKGISETDGRL